jgi:hypothetical protein
MAYLCLSSRFRGDCGVCLGETRLKNSTKIKKKLKCLGITYDRIATDDWQSFVSTFTETEHDIGKKHTVGIEGRADCGIGIGVFSGRRAVFQKSDSFIGKYLIRHSFTSMKVGCLSILCGSPPTISQCDEGILGTDQRTLGRDSSSYRTNL